MDNVYYIINTKPLPEELSFNNSYSTDDIKAIQTGSPFGYAPTLTDEYMVKWVLNRIIYSDMLNYKFGQNITYSD